jgi:hypothetical protein
MTTVGDLRDGLATNLATIPGLRVSAHLPEQINAPMAVVGLQSVVYDQAFHRGLVLYNFQVSLLAARASDRWAQIRLDEFTSTSGSTSVKAAIESDRTLGSVAYDVRVTEMGAIGAVSLDDNMYLAAEFVVEVYAD